MCNGLPRNEVASPRLASGDRKRRERPALGVARDVVLHRIDCPAFTREHGVQRFDAFIRTAHARGLDELAEELSAEQPVVLQLLIGTLERRRVGFGSLPGSVGAQIQAAEQVRPQIRHSASVSQVLGER